MMPADRPDVPEPAPAAAVPITLLQRMLSAILGALGYGKHEPIPASPDASTRLAQQRTGLALERSYLACERTLQAWIRTALSMISFGFTLGKLGNAVKSIHVKGLFDQKEYGIEGIAYFLVVLGTLGLLAAIVQHLIMVSELRRRGLRNRISITFVIALWLTVLGAFAFSALVLQI
jgi:putative membrane protein